MQLTILLQYEHFDAYSEVLGSDATHDYLYPAMGKPIVDNRTFCYEADMVENTTETIDYANDFVYAGVWLRGNSPTSDSATMAWSIRNKERDYTKCHEVYCSSITTLLPEMLADRYTFYDESATNTNTTPCFLRGSPDGLRQYFLIGSSHMRYNFDALGEDLFGADKLPAERKHDDDDLGNFHLRSRLFASDVANTILETCAQFKNSSQRNTIVFQFGAWDLMYSSLRRLIMSQYAANRIISSLSKILAGEIKCSGLTHVIWINSNPYPNCISDGSPCIFWQNFKNNAAIAASNHHFLKSLDNLWKRNNSRRVKLSVVDAFSIIKPRLIFRFENEVLRSNHFLCRLSIDGKMTMVKTPGGSAVLETLKSVLSLDRGGH